MTLTEPTLTEPPVTGAANSSGRPPAKSTSLAVQDLSGAIGSVIHGVDVRHLDDADVAEIRRI